METISPIHGSSPHFCFQVLRPRCISVDDDDSSRNTDVAEAPVQLPEADLAFRAFVADHPLTVAFQGDRTSEFAAADHAAFGTAHGDVVMFSAIDSTWRATQPEYAPHIIVRSLHAPQQHELPACELLGAQSVVDNIGSAAANTRGRQILATRADCDIVATCGIQHATLSDPAVASCSKDGIVIIWTGEGTWHMAMQMQHVIGVNIKIISCSTTVNDEKQILIGVCSDNHVQVWNIDTLRSYSWTPGKSLSNLANLVYHYLLLKLMTKAMLFCVYAMHALHNNNSNRRLCFRESADNKNRIFWQWY
jgi:hypothetical protein